MVAYLWTAIPFLVQCVIVQFSFKKLLTLEKISSPDMALTWVKKNPRFSARMSADSTAIPPST